MQAEPIQFFNRYTDRIETEQVYGESWLHWAYGNPLGKLTLHLAIKRAWFSRWYGWRMNRPGSRHKIAPFAQKYGVRENELKKPLDAFDSFNEFFSRKLKSESRPVSANVEEIIFPADGRHFGIQNLSSTRELFVKGQAIDLTKLLGDADFARHFMSGTLILSRLCPTDYHRFHFPVDAVAGPTRLLNGSLRSVNPIALRQNLSILFENKRMVTCLETEHLGTVVMIEIGATCVGSITQTFRPGQAVAKGNEKGYFQFGGSSIITLFEKDRVRLADDLVEHSSNRRELYAHMGDRMGRITP